MCGYFHCRVSSACSPIDCIWKTDLVVPGIDVLVLALS